MTVDAGENMDQSVVMWLIAQGIGIGIAGIAAVAAVNKSLTNKIEIGDAALHTRINDVRERYVRREDLDQHLTLLRTQIDKMDDKLDKLLDRQQGRPH